MKEREQPLSNHKYMLLGRLIADLNYFFGFGHGNEKRLFHLNLKKHIVETRKLWDSL